MEQEPPPPRVKKEANEDLNSNVATFKSNVATFKSTSMKSYF